MNYRSAKFSRLHAHRAGDASFRHYAEGRNQKILGFSLLLTLGFAVIEALAGFWSNSLALISDAGHMVTDSAALGLALLAQSIAKWHPSEKYTFGFGRVEALAAFVNALMLLAMVGWIGWEAAQRLATPQPVQGATVFIVASIGLTVNLIIAWLLSHDKDSLNTKAAMVNVLGDMLGSIGALAAGVVIYFTGWLRIDPMLSIFVCMLILRSAIGILGEAYHFLMKGVPRHIDYLQVGTDLSAVKGVLSVHDLHIWEMSPGQPALIGHIEVRDLQEWPEILHMIKAMLLTKHGIDHVTLQAELPKMVRGE